MTLVEWMFYIIWPIIVVYIYSGSVDKTLKARAEVTADGFNKAGKAIILIDKAIEELNRKL